MLAAAIGLVGYQTYRVWRDAGSAPLPDQRDRPAGGKEAKQDTAQKKDPNIEAIVKTNLFDPERGSGPARGGASGEGARIDELVLVGTVVTDTGPVAIIRVPKQLMVASGRGVVGTSLEMRRLSLGDTVFGYQVSEIQPDRIVFRRGSAVYELRIDFSRKGERAKPGLPAKGPGPATGNR